MAAGSATGITAVESLAMTALAYSTDGATTVASTLPGKLRTVVSRSAMSLSIAAIRGEGGRAGLLGFRQAMSLGPATRLTPTIMARGRFS